MILVPWARMKRRYQVINSRLLTKLMLAVDLSSHRCITAENRWKQK